MIKLNFGELDELSVFFDEAYTNLTEMAGKIDDIYWEIEKEDVNSSTIKKTEQITGTLCLELTKLFRIEEDIIFSELEKVMPEQSSVSAIKSDNANILLMCEAIKSRISKKEDLKKEKDLLQAEMIAIADLIRRNANKKEGILYHEVRTLLPEEKLTEMIQKIKSGYLNQIKEL